MRGKLLLVGMALLLVMGMVLVGCGDSGVSQEDYDEVVAELDACEADLATAEADLATAEADLAAAEAEVAALEAEITEMEAIVAEELLPDVLTMLGVVDEIEAWHADPTDTALMGALTAAIDATGIEGLQEKWNAFLAASAEGDPGFTLFQVYGYILGKCSYVASAFPTEVQPVMGVGDEMAALVEALDISLLGQMTTAVNESGDAELIDMWNQITATFSTDLPGAMVMMADMQVWMLSEIAAAAPSS